MKFDYIKCHGSGNEFIMVDTVKQNLDGVGLAEFARFICDRENSVGADGLVCRRARVRNVFGQG